MTMAPSSAHRRARRRGFTLIEVMMALTILTIGILGVVSMQKAAVVTDNDAQQFTIATQLARTWLDRLTRDATTWNHPSSISSTSNINTTVWLQLVNAAASSFPNWYLPTSNDILPPTLVESPAFDRNGVDISTQSKAALVSGAVYCTHLRLRYIYTDQLIRAEVRVLWRKRSLGNPTTYATEVGFNNSFCDPAAVQANVNAIGQDQANFHFVYAATTIARQGPP